MLRRTSLERWALLTFAAARVRLRGAFEQALERITLAVR
jgi:hypothetical protein